MPRPMRYPSHQLPELLGREPGIAGDGPHGDGVDGVMARYHEAPLAIAEDQMPRFPHDAIAQLLEHSDGLFLADPWQPGHQRASSRVSTCLTPASSASTSSQRPIASRMLARASSRLSPWEWQPGRSRQLTDQPSSVCSKRILYDTLSSSTCLDASRPEQTTSAHP